MNALALWRWSRWLGALALVGGILATLARSGRGPTGFRISRCPIHGVAYDAELEVCPECAKS